MEKRKVIPYIPDRVDEGYGLNIEALNKIKQEMGGDLVISVDCGIRSVAEVAHAREIGLDMIVTDHHSLGRELPPALAVINPKRPNSAYPETMLAGVGIAYKLAQALHYEMASYEDFATQNLLDLVAIGTVADVAPLLGENRKLVVEGLEVLNTLQRPGVSALAHVAGVRAGMITAETIGFALGPRINAAGRLDHAYSAAKLLATPNLLEATKLANELNELNRKRQAITSELTQHAELLLENRDDYLLFAADDKFLPGVVGLVASRLKRKLLSADHCGGDGRNREPRLLPLHR
jgi:single-stranded-DNA-specific exonuclease